MEQQLGQDKLIFKASVTVNSGITDLNYINTGNPSDPLTAGWHRTAGATTGATDGYLYNYNSNATFGVPGVLNGYRRTLITIHHRDVNGAEFTRYYYSDLHTNSFLAADIDNVGEFIDILTNNNSQNGRTYYRDGLTSSSDRVTLHSQPGDENEIFINLNNSTDNDNMIDYPFAVTFGAVTSTVDRSEDLSGG